MMKVTEMLISQNSLSKYRRLARSVVNATVFAIGTFATVAASYAACGMTTVNSVIQSTGTGPFDTGDSCAAGGLGHLAGNDACSTDRVVRTNDTYVARFNFKVLAGQKVTNLTFRSTLPLVSGRKVAVWDSVPAQCDGPGTGISADGLTLVCNAGTVDRQGTGDLTSGLLAQVKATIDGANGDQISGVQGEVTSTECTLADNPATTFPAVEVSARQKADFKKDVAYAGGQTAYTYGGQPGYLVSWYVYVDQYDPSGAGSKGGQSLASPVRLRDVPTNFPPNAIWFDCGKADSYQGTISCPATGTPVVNGVQQDVVLTAQAGEETQFLVAGGKNTASGLDPSTSIPQRLGTYYLRYWVSLSDINAAGGQINLRNDIPAALISGTDRSGAPVVDTKTDNNGLPITVVGTLPGGLYKYVANDWGYAWSGPVPGQGNSQFKQMQGTNNYGDSGTGLTFPNQIFYPRLDYYNPSIVPATNVVQCEAFDSTKVRLAEITTMPGHAAAYISATPADRGQPLAGYWPQGYVTEYGVSPQQGGPGTASRCDDGDAVWYPTLTAAAAAGKREAINRVRNTIPEVSGGQNFYLLVAQQTRPGVNGAVIDDYYSAKASNMVGSNGQAGGWVLSSYDKISNNGVGLGKRFTLTTALARVQKDALNPADISINQTFADARVTYKLTPSLQTIVESPPATYVTIVDTLPSPLVYVAGSSKVGTQSREPDSIEPVTGGTKLTWTLNGVIPNTPLPVITFGVTVPPTVSPNSILVNTVEISTPDDVSDVSQRRATKSLTVLNPPGLKVYKSVANSKIDPNGTAVFKVQISNFEDVPTVVDSIDVLPYVGDGRVPVTAYSGSRGLQAAPVSSGGGTARYSNRAPASILFDPTSPGNTPDASAGWCLATEFGQGGCPASFAAVTAWRVTGSNIGANSTIDIDFSMPTSINALGNVYTNRFYTKSSDPLLTTLRSNDVQVTVELGSLSGTVYVDVDSTATKGASEPGIGGTIITLCSVAPVNGACPAGQTVLNPLTNQPITTTTAADGTYKLQGIPGSPPSGYFVVETRPVGFDNGPVNAAGSLGGNPTANLYSAVKVPVGSNGTNYDFGHLTTDLFTTVNMPAVGVVPGDPVIASVTIGNSSLTPSANTEVTLTLEPNLTGVVITPPAGWVIAPAGAYDPATGKVKLIPTSPGASIPAQTQYNVGVQFIAPEKTTLRIRSDITNSVIDLTSVVNPAALTNPNTADANRNAHIGSVAVLAMSIDTRKRVGTPRPLTNSERTTLGLTLTDAAFMVPYRVIVANKGPIVATNVQLTDRLDFTFPSPAAIVGVFQANAGFGGARGARLVTAGSHPNCQVAGTAFNGVSQPNFLNGSFNLPALPTGANPETASACILEFTVVVNYGANPAPQTALKNSTFASANNNPNNPGPSAFNAQGAPTYGAPGHRVSDASTDTPQVPPQPYPGGDYPTAPTPGPIASNDDVADPTPVILGIPQQIDVRKSASVPVQTDVSGRKFRTAYTVNLTNTGTVIANNVQLSENLRFTFPAPATFAVSSTSLVSGNCPINAAFNGGNTNSAAGYNLVGASGSSTHTLNPTQSCVFSFVVDVTYAQPGVPTAAAQNRIFASTALGANEGPPFDATGNKTGDAPNMIAKDTSATVAPAIVTYGATVPADPGAPSTPNGDVGSSTIAPIRTLEVIKSVAGQVRIPSPGKYVVPYTTKITAVGAAGEVLPNVQAIDNLLQTFRRNGGTVPIITVQAHQAPVASPAGGYCPSSFTSFNGNTVQQLFSGNTSLTVGQSCEFKFEVQLDYGTNTLDEGPHHNTVYASSVPGSSVNTGGTVALNPSVTSPNGSNGVVAGTWTPPVGAIAIDASTDGTSVPTSAGADTPLPTPVRFAKASPVSAIKYVENLTIPGAAPVSGHNIAWTLVFKNEGPYPLTGVQISDELKLGLTAPQILSVAKVSPAAGTTDAVSANTNYNGASDKNLLQAVTSLQAGQSLIIKLKTQIKGDFTGTLTNQANLSAAEYGGPTGTLLPTSAVNPGAPTCPSTQACAPAGIVIPSNALKSQPANNTTKDQPNQLAVVQGGSIAGQTWLDANKDKVISAGEKPIPGLRVAVYAIDPATGARLAEVTDPLNRPVTDANGAYRVGGLSPSANGGPQYDVAFYNEAGTSVFADPRPMAVGNPNNGTLPTNGTRDRITAIKVSSGAETPAQNLPLDPAGVVYDSITRDPVPGAVVTFVGPPGFDPALHLLGGAANAAQTVGANGFYQFILLAGAPSGDYSLAITPPATYLSPSILIPAEAGTLTPPPGVGQTFPVQPQTGAPQTGVNEVTTYYLKFKLSPGSSRDVVNNHIPLDPRAQPRLSLSKIVNKANAEVGDVVTYTLRVRNVGQSAAPNVAIADRLPAGFRYIPGTTQVAVGAGAAYAVSPDPRGGVGPALTFVVPSSIAVNNEAVFSYRVRIAVGSMQGDGINRATATSGRISSNEARAKVKVDAGVFTSEACIAGKVYVDCNNNHVQDAEELGIPGVRLFLQDGTNFITDSEGKYSYCGLAPKSHALKLDMLTMPKGSRPTTTTNRNLGDANSIFLDIKNGELTRADFAEGSCSNPVLEQVKARRSKGETRNVQTEKRGQPAKKFEGKSSAYPQQGTDSANQPLIVERPLIEGGSK
jgi:uncharacterized repeat protein (TIGR01451 family)